MTDNVYRLDDYRPAPDPAPAELTADERERVSERLAATEKAARSAGDRLLEALAGTFRRAMEATDGS